ncbi:SMI1/KNR4 family protein [Streptomyces sp. NPDC091267]|uniref:SMI1/KNR4 family protein n=1 Tax=unclassified Streptomyces TaxID=2593676 RepID=UPI003440C0C8
MTPSEDLQFPAALAAAMVIRGAWIGEDGVDFEPFDSFLSADETTHWLRSWTGNSDLSGDDFRMFGMDGTGGSAAFWLVRQGRPLVEQPVVFLGSEGETGVVARSQGAFLWLLADGFGPLEAATSDGPEPGWAPQANRDLAAVAEEFAPGHRESATAVMEQAAREFPDFDDTIMRICR